MSDQPLALQRFDRVGVWERDLLGGVGRWDAQVFRLYEIDPAGQPPSMDEVAARHFHPDDIARAVEDWRRSTERAGRYGTHFRLRFADGRIKYLHSLWEVVADADGRPVRALGVLIDDTESVEMALRLHAAEQRAGLATQAAGLGLWERDLAGVHHRWDAQMYRLRGLEPDDPRPPADLRLSTLHPDDREMAVAAFERRAQQRDERMIRFRVVWPDGTERWLGSRGMVVQGPADDTPRLIGVNLDITDQVRSEELVSQRAAAEQASRAKSEFLARMSHELRTPLNAVLGFAQLLATDGAQPLTERQRSRVQHIRLAGEHLLALINDTLDLASIEAGTLPLADEVVPLGVVADDVVNWIRPAAEEAGLALQVDAMAGAVRGDGRRVRQVLLNLLSNAVKYNRPGGRVTVSPKRGGDRRWHGVEVADTGAGLTPAQLKRVFEPFDRLGAERRGIEGTGIGLTIVRHLVEQMGGRVEVASEPGAGSRFTVWLRAA